MAGFVTRALSLLSPRRAADREANLARMRLMEGVGRNYDGAARTKRNQNWNPRPGNANETLAPAAQLLRARAYDLLRNNPTAASIAHRHADNIVGTGIIPKFRTGDDRIDKILKQKWEEFTKPENIDPAGQMNFDAKTYQAVVGMVVGGEMFARRRDRRLSDGLPVPFQIQTYEPDMVDASRPTTGSKRPAHTIIQGIEFDLLGHRYGYWMFKESPASNRNLFGTAGNVTFVPSEEMIHLYEPKRDQVRGETWFSPIMTRLRNLDEYQEAEIIRKKTEACLVGIIQPADDTEDDETPQIGFNPETERVDPVTGEVIENTDWGLTDIDGDQIQQFEPGMFYQAKPGSTVNWNTPATSAGYDTYKRTELREIASGARMPYEVMTGDLSEVSFASGRMGTIEYRRFVERVQWLYVIPMWCDPIAAWFVRAVKTMGLIPDATVVKVEWAPPAFQSITPIDDANTDVYEIRAGLTSWDSKLRARGLDPDVIAAEIEKRNKFWDDKKIVLDIDPRYLSRGGQKHASSSGGGDEGASNASSGEQDREAAGRTGRPKRRRRAAGRQA